MPGNITHRARSHLTETQCPRRKASEPISQLSASASTLPSSMTLAMGAWRHPMFLYTFLQKLYSSCEISMMNTTRKKRSIAKDDIRTVESSDVICLNTKFR